MTTGQFNVIIIFDMTCKNKIENETSKLISHFTMSFSIVVKYNPEIFLKFDKMSRIIMILKQCRNSFCDKFIHNLSDVI